MYTIAEEANIIIRESDGAFIPMDCQNLDYIKYMEWLADGGVPKQFEAPLSDAVPADERMT
ncbi:hypothetical protein [Janthinobacterium sp. FW305-128]|uniref:hypothetical protein n=1 Tax=Janthinobacterium sp. FW305-128 TaxID=2775055 RepID=UPI001E3C0519|nr:hypothetical protein [Janthinobacterium sp. FW305-128]MCC7681865.1 hypothetical protein [Janthinobacterium sp. FW305-128]